MEKVQDNLGGGYLSAFPTEHFDRLQNLQPVWAPYYVVSAVALAANLLCNVVTQLHISPLPLLLHTKGLVYFWARFIQCKTNRDLQIHKIMAGLLDHHTFAHNQVALQMVVDMAAYFGKRVDDTLHVNGTDHWHEMLNNEFGGMSEVLHNLYGITKYKAHLR